MRSPSATSIAFVMLGLLFAGCSGGNDTPPLDAATEDSDSPPLDAAPDGSDDGGQEPIDPSTWIEPVRPVLEPAPPWDPPFAVDGEPGWREGTTPLCVADTGDVSSHEIFASSDGVYVLTTIANNVFAGDPWSERPSGTSVLVHDGTGWTQRVWAPESAASGGGMYSLFATDYGAIYVGGLGCGITELYPGPVDAEHVRCSFVAGFDTWSSFSMASNGEAFAIARGALHRRTAGSAGVWSEVTSLPSDPEWVSSFAPIWTDGTTAVAATAHQNVVRFASGTLEDLSNDAPAGTYVAVHAQASTDVWLGTTTPDLVHFDGETFTHVAIDTACEESPIQEIWSHGDEAFFITRYAFGRSDGESVELIVDLPCNAGTTFEDLSGISATEVFLTVVEREYARYRCGGTFAVWYDGDAFHKF